MLLILRRLKRRLFESGEFHKYLLYAFGEMVLVIIGILIALQIDNWNTEKQQEAMLQSYLKTIARNMREDVDELESLRAVRSTRILDGVRAGFFLASRGQTSFEVDEIFFFNRIISQASQNLNFNANTSGYEALKSSGVIERLQGRDIERLLSRYYDQVTQIADMEGRMNELVSSLNLQFLLSIPVDIEFWAFGNPRGLPEDRFQALQPVYADVINRPVTRELIKEQRIGFLIVREYDSLIQLGNAFVSSVETGETSSMAADNDLLAVDYATAGVPDYGDLVVGGRLMTQSYYLVSAVNPIEPLVFDFRAVQQIGDSLHFAYPGSESWAVLYAGIFGLADDRPTLDYSSFDKLVLELRSDSGRSTLSVHIKDRELPDSEPPESVELQLTDDWQAYEIDLASFKKTDLSMLIVPLGFGFYQQPQSFSLRNARYVKDE